MHGWDNLAPDVACCCRVLRTFATIPLPYVLPGPPLAKVTSGAATHWMLLCVRFLHSCCCLGLTLCVPSGT